MGTRRRADKLSVDFDSMANDGERRPMDERVPSKGSWGDIPGIAKRGGVLGTGMSGEDFVNVLTRAAALAQGQYGQAAQIGQLIGADKRRASERDQERDDYRWKKETDLEYDTNGDDSFTRALAAANILPGSPEYIELARKRAEMLVNPVQLVPDGFGGMTPVRPQSMPSGPPIGSVIPDPRKAGGGVGNGVGGFPRWRR